MVASSLENFSTTIENAEKNELDSDARHVSTNPTISA
jgi:hypothetical protein